MNSFLLQIGWQLSNLTTPDIPAGISPVWDDKTQSIYFVNLFSMGKQDAIYRYDYTDGNFYSAYIEGVSGPSFIMPINDECVKNTKCNRCGNRLFAVGVGHSVMIIRWNGKSTRAKVVRTLFSVEQNVQLSRTNFARADRKGRFYGGTFSQTFCNASASSAFYRYTKKGGVDLLFNGIVSTTGIAFNEELEKMYHLDSCSRLITVFDWCPKTGDICNFDSLFLV